MSGKDEKVSTILKEFDDLTWDEQIDLFINFRNTLISSREATAKSMIDSANEQRTIAEAMLKGNEFILSNALNSGVKAAY